MTNLKKALFTTLLLAVVIAPSAGCGAARAAGGAAKFAGTICKGAAKALKPSNVAKMFNGSNGIKTATTGRGLGATKFLQTPQTRLPLNVGSFDNFVPDEFTDVYVAAPQDEAAFIRIYRRPPTRAELMNITRARVDAFIQASDEFKPLSTAKGIDNFAAFLGTSPAKHIIMIGHNQRGNFYFPSGESMPIDAIARLINAHNKRGIFLSCEANKYVPKGYPASTTKLTHDTALKIADDLSRNLRNDALRIGNPVDDLTVVSEDSQLFAEGHAADNLLDIREQRVSELIQATINSGERDAQVRHTFKQVSKAGGIGSGFTYSMIKLRTKGEAQKRSGTGVRQERVPLVRLVSP